MDLNEVIFNNYHPLEVVANVYLLVTWLKHLPFTAAAKNLIIIDWGHFDHCRQTYPSKLFGPTCRKKIKRKVSFNKSFKIEKIFFIIVIFHKIFVFLFYIQNVNIAFLRGGNCKKSNNLFMWNNDQPLIMSMQIYKVLIEETQRMLCVK